MRDSRVLTRKQMTYRCNEGRRWDTSLPESNRACRYELVHAHHSKVSHSRIFTAFFRELGSWTLLAHTTTEHYEIVHGRGLSIFFRQAWWVLGGVTCRSWIPITDEKNSKRPHHSWIIVDILRSNVCKVFTVITPRIGGNICAFCPMEWVWNEQTPNHFILQEKRILM